MNMDTQAQAVDAVARLLVQSGVVETDPVDFIEFLLTQVQIRDLDALADDIVCFVLRWDDLRAHVSERLKVRRNYLEDGRQPDIRRDAENIYAAIRATVSGRFTDRLPIGSGR